MLVCFKIISEFEEEFNLKLNHFNELLTTKFKKEYESRLNGFVDKKFKDENGSVENFYEKEINQLMVFR